MERSTIDYREVLTSLTRFKLSVKTLVSNTYSQLYYNSFLPSVNRDWNELQMDTRNASSLNTFKHKLNTDIKLPPVYFNDGIVTVRSRILDVELTVAPCIAISMQKKT